jgi:hypothetical protein
VWEGTLLPMIPIVELHLAGNPRDAMRTEVPDLRGQHRDSTVSLKLHSSHALRRVTTRFRVGVEAVNGRGWDRTSAIARVNAERMGAGGNKRGRS